MSGSPSEEIGQTSSTTVWNIGNYFVYVPTYRRKKLINIPTMTLKIDLDFFGGLENECRTYADAEDLLKEWYKSRPNSPIFSLSGKDTVSRNILEKTQTPQRCMSSQTLWNRYKDSKNSLKRPFLQIFSGKISKGNKRSATTGATQRRDAEDSSKAHKVHVALAKWQS